MRHILPVVMAALLPVVAPSHTQQPTQTTAPLDPAKLERGVKVYAAQRCASCHSIEGQGNQRYPLDGAGSRLDRDAIRTWIVEPQKMNPRVRKRGFTGLTPEDLDGLVTYILSLKTRQ